jgi:hypothetical protein
MDDFYEFFLKRLRKQKEKIPEEQPTLQIEEYPSEPLKEEKNEEKKHTEIIELGEE